MQLVKRGSLVWCLLAVIMIVQGGVRATLAAPFFGELLAHQLSVVSASLVIGLVTWLLLPWIGASTARQQLRLGVYWLGLTVAFEFVFGHWVMGASWSRLLADYDLRAGRLWTVVLCVTLLAPWLAGRIRDRYGA